jgi:hypothetical protein
MWAYCGDAATWDVGDPVQVVTNQLEDCVDNLGEIVESAIIGFACEPAEGLNSTRHLWSAGTVTPVAKEGTEIGDLVMMIGEAGTNRWGIEEAAAGANDAEFQIVAVLDDEMNPIDADATVALGTAPATGDGNGWIVFRPVKLLSQLTEGGAA